MDFSQLFVALFTLLIGGGILVFTGNILLKAKGRTEWLETTGEIIDSGINEVKREEETMYFPAIRYRYKVNLVEYESTRIQIGDPPYAGSLLHTKSIIKKYPLHERVTVYYNPEDHQESVLNKSAPASGMILLILLGISIVLCGMLLLIGFLVQAGIIEALDPNTVQIEIFA